MGKHLDKQVDIEVVENGGRFLERRFHDELLAETLTLGKTMRVRLSLLGIKRMKWWGVKRV